MNNGQFRIAVIKGDGIGVDVTDATLAVIGAAERRVGDLCLDYEFLDAGAAYFRASGRDMAPGAEDAAEAADAIFLGAIGLPAVRHEDGTEIAPHLRLRERLQLYAGVRPVKAYPTAHRRLADARAADIDLVILRESTEGLFYSAAAHNRSQAHADAARLIEAAIQAGFEAGRLRPVELGGDQGTAALTREVLALVKEDRA